MFIYSFVAIVLSVYFTTTKIYLPRDFKNTNEICMKSSVNEITQNLVVDSEALSLKVKIRFFCLQ
jgi:hypothetical protein